MQVPNWQHHSKKEQKRHLKPQALRQAKARLAQFKKCHKTSRKREVSLYCRYIRNESDGSQTRNQVPTCQTAGY